MGPCLSLMMLSVSTKGSPRSLAMARPILVFPEAGGPMRTTDGLVATVLGHPKVLGNRREVGRHVPLNLLQRVATELLAHGVGEY